MLIIAIIAVVAVVVFAWLTEGDLSDGWSLIFFILTLVASSVSVITARHSGYGHLLGSDNLKENEVYETVSAVSENPEDKVFYVTLRERDGDIRAFVLEHEPPPVFKVVKTKNGVEYRSY